MQKAWTPPVRSVFVGATLLGLFSTLQAYRLTSLSAKDGMDVEVVHLLILNLAYWYVPACLTLPIFSLAHHFRLDSKRWLRALLVHASAAALFSVIHTAAMLGVRSTFWPAAGKPPNVEWTTFIQRQYLNQLDWALMTYAAIVGLSYALGYYRESRAREIKSAQLETSLAEARLKTLEAQLHPHFLFNTLHAISTLVHTKPDAADRMISRLSDLLRLAFESSGATGVSLQQELEFLQKYLEIEQTRFQDRLSVRFDIDPETFDAEVPRLILQPLVENAIKHGVSPRSGPGLVAIASRRLGTSLWLEVRDDGVGLTAGARHQLRNGIGLSNTRDRLACLYGDAHRLEFSDGAGGLAVRIEIPFRRMPSGSDRATIRVA
jgi:two-component system, LytTR family, sensor kinase